MSNVIIQEQLREWNREMIGRLLLATGIVGILGAVVVALALLPAYIDARTERVHREEALAAIQAETEQGAKTAGGRVDRNTLLAVRKRLQAFEEISKGQRVAEAIAFVVERRPEGMQIRSLNYMREEKEGLLDLGGSVDDRALLRPYADEFKGKELFTRATIPITSLARLEGGAFSISTAGPF